MVDRRQAYDNTTKTRLRKWCHHRGHDIKDVVIVHLRKMWFSPRETRREKKEVPSTISQGVTTPEGVTITSPVNYQVRLLPGTPTTLLVVRRPLTQKPPHRHWQHVASTTPYRRPLYRPTSKLATPSTPPPLRPERELAQAPFVPPLASLLRFGPKEYLVVVAAVFEQLLRPYVLRIMFDR